MNYSEESAMLHLALGSLNSAKRLGVLHAFNRNDQLDIEIHAFDVPLGTVGQPVCLEEIISGACARARASLVAASAEGKTVQYGIGVQAGVMRINRPNDTWIDVTACIIDSGKRTYYGQSFGFVVPQNIMELVLNKSYDLDTAMKEAGLIGDEKTSQDKGIISILSGGADDRMSQVESAVCMALMQIHSPYYV